MTNRRSHTTSGLDTTGGSSNDLLDYLRRVAPEGLEIDDIDDSSLPPLDVPNLGLPCPEEGQGTDREATAARSTERDTRVVRSGGLA